MARGSTVFRQVSPYVEFFHARLKAWVHYIPVADNLADLPERIRWAEAHPQKAARIAEAGRALASSVNVYELACFWWQLTTALAPLESFQPRTAASLGFVRHG